MQQRREVEEEVSALLPLLQLVAPHVARQERVPVLLVLEAVLTWCETTNICGIIESAILRELCNCVISFSTDHVITESEIKISHQCWQHFVTPKLAIELLDKLG